MDREKILKAMDTCLGIEKISYDKMDEEQFRKLLELEPKQLLHTGTGVIGDILNVSNGNVTIGMLDTGRTITYTIENFLSRWNVK